MAVKRAQQAGELDEVQVHVLDDGALHSGDVACPRGEGVRHVHFARCNEASLE